MHSPTCSQLHLGLIPYSLPKVQLPLYKLDKVKFRGAHLFIFCNWGSKEVLLLGHAQCSQKNCWLVTQYGSYKKKQKSCELTHDLINMNHTLCPQNLVINHHQKLFFTICPYPESYFFKKIWMMPKHICTPEI
jgi:hypothetical protein